MNISGLNIPAGLTARATTAQQNDAASTPAQKNRLAPTLPATDQYRPASDSIIDAEYVDFHSPIRPPTEQQIQWRNLIVEEEETPELQSTQSGIDKRHQLRIASYGQNSSDILSPGRFVNLLA